MSELSQQLRFIQNELWILAWNASVQRAKLYRDTPSSEWRQNFNTDVYNFIDATLLPQYKTGVAEDQHYQNLRKLIAHGTELGRIHLADGIYRLGIAQKAFNLYLKYMWCLSHIVEPPHCPVDRIILEKTRLKNEMMNWTQMRDEADYRKAMQAIREEADKDGMSIARWELHIYDRRNSRHFSELPAA